jgi:hypothetical protein
MIDEKNLKQKISWHCPFKYSMFSYKARLLVDGKEVEATLGKQVMQEDVEVLSVLDPAGTQVGRSTKVKSCILI